MSGGTEILGVGSRVDHPEYGKGVVIKLNKAAYTISFITLGVKTIGKAYNNWEVIERIPTTEAISMSEVEEALANVLRAFSDIQETVELGDKWKGGVMLLQPENTNLKPKEVPIEVFFNKIVMVRDRLRVMEQRINSSTNLDNEEKVNLQQYLTRIYGSMTTFNVLFKRKEDYFKGEGK
jgi:DUF438 domain-containing protein